MTKKKATDVAAGPPVEPRPHDRRALEKSLTDIGRLLSEHQFASIEEMNTFLAEHASGTQLPKPSRELTPLEQAQDLMYEAWDATGKRRSVLARRALALSPDSADAYVLLAEEARDSAKAKDLYEQGVRAGERALGPQAFEGQMVGEFWMIPETRPYMRARQGLAFQLWEIGQSEEAIAHLQDMLRLNPGDNQGVRYPLSIWLLEAEDYAALEKLLADFEDDASATWAYNRALMAFRQNGSTPQTDALLSTAFATNAYIPLYLLHVFQMPDALPDYVGFGDEAEAVSYVSEADDVWWTTAVAPMWLADRIVWHLEQSPKSTRNRRTSKKGARR